MIIFINSRRVETFHLRISAGSTILFDDFVYSRPKNEIEIEHFEGDALKFQWSFCITPTERKALEKKADCPEWGTYAYDDRNIFQEAGCDFIYDHACPIPAKGVYMTIIKEVTADEPTLHLMFRRSSMNRDMPLLYIMNRYEREKFSVVYERVENFNTLLHMTKKIICRRVVTKIVEVLLILSAVYLLEVYWPKRYIIYPLIFLVCYIVQTQFRLIKHYRKFFRQIEQYPSFKENKGKIEML